MVEEGNNIRARLMDSEDDRSVIGLSKCYQTLNNVECIEGVESASWLVQKEDAWTGNEFTSNAHSSLLATRDTPTAAFFLSDQLVFDMEYPKLPFHFVDSLLFG